MAIQATCPECGEKQSLPDKLAGKKTNCRECGTLFKAQEIEEDKKPTSKKKSEAVQAAPPGVPPDGKRARSRYDDDDDELPLRKRPAPASTMPLMLILGGVGAIAALLLLVVGGGAFFFLLRSAPADQAQIAANKPAQADPAPPQPDPNQNQPIDPNQPVPPKQNPPKQNPPKQIPPKQIPPKVEPPPPPVKWDVQADPGPDVARAPANPKGAMPLFGSPHFVYPSTPSPFVAVRHGQFGKEGWQVIDLQSFKQVAALNMKLDLNDEALSPDGKFLAGKGRLTPASTPVHVVSLADGRTIQTIQLDTKAAALRMIEFSENGHLITYKTRGLTGFYEVFNIASGKDVKTFTVEGLLDRKNNLALSPGRKYLAVAHKNQIDIFRILTGERVGELAIPIANGMFKALAFSPDGSELACLISAFGSSSQLLTWKMNKGEPGVVHKFVKDVQTLVKNPYGYQGGFIEWIPDGSGWLLFGQLLVDRQTGAPVYTIAYDAKEFRYWPRRLVGKDHVVMAGGDFQKSQMGIVALPSNEIAAAIKNAQTGAAPAAALPAVKPADLASARKIPAPNGNVAWMVEADAALPAKAKLAPQPIALRSKPQEIVRILFSSAEAAQAVVVNGVVPNPLAPRKQFRADRYSLTDGKFISGCELFASDKAEPKFPAKASASLSAELSPDGTRLIVRQADEPNRLDVWDLTAGKHLVGWQPHDGAAIESFAALDGDRVITAGADRLILWKLPECQAIYVAEGYRAPVQVSPGRKLAAVGAGTSIAIIDCASGALKGQLEPPGGIIGSFRSAAFSRDGKEFAAAIMPGTGGAKLARWSLGKGNWLGSCEGNAGDQGMAFMGKHVMHGATLYDFTLKGPLWMYTVPGQGGHVSGSPDGRHWFASSVQNSLVLTAQTLPDAGASALAATIAGGGAQPVVTPGMAVQFQINTDSPKFRTQVENSLQNNLKSQGYTLGAGGLNVAINTRESPTGVVVEYEVRKIGGGFKIERIKINERKIDCSYVITDAKGAVLSKMDTIFRTPGSMTFQGDNYEQQLNEGMWNGTISWGASIPIPTNLYRIQGQLQPLPKIGPLAGGG